jgi:hypothetical protein
MMKDVNSTMIYSKNFCKCHIVPLVQHDNKNVKQNKRNNFSSFSRAWNIGREVATKEHEKTFGNYGNTVHVDCGGSGFTTVRIYIQVH